MKKPAAAIILGATSLTAARRGEPLLCCTICGVAVDPLDLPVSVWREHDERDEPSAGVDALVFVGQGREHAACRKRLHDHPRLYAEVAGDPGYFPELCGACIHRKGLACKHPELRANGGPGLGVHLDRFAMVVCVRGAGCAKPIHHAVRCSGRRTLQVVVDR